MSLNRARLKLDRTSSRADAPFLAGGHSDEFVNIGRLGLRNDILKALVKFLTDSNTCSG